MVAGTTTFDGLTVEYSRAPGQNLRRKIMTVLKLQLQTMLLSTAYNSRQTVVLNVYNCMFEVGKRTFAYVKNVAKYETKITKSLQGSHDALMSRWQGMLTKRSRHCRKRDRTRDGHDEK